MDVAGMMAAAMREAAWETTAYRPMPHGQGPVCETAWLTLPLPRGRFTGSWADYNDLLQPCTDGCGCPDGGGSDG